MARQKVSEWKYRVVCLDCDIHHPFYEGSSPHDAKATLSSLSQVEGHRLVIQWTEIKWRTMAPLKPDLCWIHGKPKGPAPARNCEDCRAAIDKSVGR